MTTKYKDYNGLLFYTYTLFIVFGAYWNENGNAIVVDLIALYGGVQTILYCFHKGTDPFLVQKHTSQKQLSYLGQFSGFNILFFILNINLYRQFITGHIEIQHFQ